MVTVAGRPKPAAQSRGVWGRAAGLFITSAAVVVLVVTLQERAAAWDPSHAPPSEALFLRHPAGGFLAGLLAGCRLISRREPSKSTGVDDTLIKLWPGVPADSSLGGWGSPVDLNATLHALQQQLQVGSRRGPQ